MPDGRRTPPPSSTRERDRLARRRIQNILLKYTVAGERTLEAKIADAGPFAQRINPHIITRQLRYLMRRGEVGYDENQSGRWYFLAKSPKAERQRRVKALTEVHSSLERRLLFNQRLGQTLEIAAYRALEREYPHPFFGAFTDLSAHGDDQLYSKEEPPSSTGRALGTGQRKVDFLLTAGAHGLVAVEVKNTRPWIYPRHKEIRDLLWKAVALDAVPVLIARRFHYLTFKFLNECGGIVHQVYNQRFPEADADLAEAAKDKNLLGYFDIRLGNEPDDRLLKFIGSDLATVVPRARARFDERKEMIKDFTDDPKRFMHLPEAVGVPEED